MVCSSFSSRPSCHGWAGWLPLSAAQHQVLPGPYHPYGRALILSVQSQPGYHKLTSLISCHSALRFHTNVHEGLSHIHLHSLLAWGNGVQQDIRSEEAAEPAAPVAIHTLDRLAAASSLPLPLCCSGICLILLNQSAVCEKVILLSPPHLFKYLFSD